MTALGLVARVVALFPWKTLRFGGRLLGLFVGSIVRVRREHVENAMRRAGVARVASSARAMYASLGTALLEFLWMTGRGLRGAPAISLDDNALAVIAALRDGRRGVVVATAHTGNWDLVACALGRALPLSVVTKRLSVTWLDDFWQRERASFGVELVHRQGGFRRALRAVGEGRAVAWLIDQRPDRSLPSRDVHFLGDVAPCDAAPAVLAARAGVPLVLALGRRLADGTHRVEVPLVLEPPWRSSAQWIDEATSALQRELERFVLDHPEQWLWMHRRWQRAIPPTAPASRTAVLADTAPLC